MREKNLVPVLLSGGAGSRLWPVSRTSFPKQFFNLLDPNLSMVQQCVSRLCDFSQLNCGWIIVANEEHRFIVEEQVRDIGVCIDTIILEPVGRNTAPAVALAAFDALLRHDNATLLIQTSDHLISDIDLFYKSIETAFDLQPSLCAFGITPILPETGYGYIKAGDRVGNRNAFYVSEFYEKPNLETAMRYLESGDYLWNSGMFLLDAELFLEQLSGFEPVLYKTCRTAWEAGIKDMNFFRVDRDIFDKCPSISIDHAVMERTDRGVVVPFQGGWADIGSWDSVFSKGYTDQEGNSIKGDGVFLNTTDSYIHAQSRLVAGVGLKNIMIIETADCVLVADRSSAQSIKTLVENLREKNRAEVDANSLVYRPWGTYESLDLGDRFQVKRIVVKPGAKLSLQKHFHRAEHWVVVVGTALVKNGESEFLLTENQSTYIPVGVLHRLSNPGNIPLIMIEVQSGTYLHEDDIVRISDDFGRV